MELKRLKDVQIAELMKWADTLDNIITPDKLVPTNIRDYPKYIETSERLKLICKNMSEEIKNQLQTVEDVIMDNIENAELVLKYDRGGMPVKKKKYDTVDKRKRELRFRLSQDEEYQVMALEQKQWALMYSDWVSHAKRLHRDFRLMEINYQSNGGDGT